MLSSGHIKFKGPILLREPFSVAINFPSWAFVNLVWRLWLITKALGLPFTIKGNLICYIEPFTESLISDRAKSTWSLASFGTYGRCLTNLPFMLSVYLPPRNGSPEKPNFRFQLNGSCLKLTGTFNNPFL